MPQLSSLFRFASQPLATSPSQLANSGIGKGPTVAQISVGVPRKQRQFWALGALRGHMRPHAPQFTMSLSRSASQPLVGSESQSPHPSVHASVHAPVYAFSGIGDVVVRNVTHNEYLQRLIENIHSVEDCSP